MRQNFIAGNWKMHKTRAEARELAGSLVSSLGDTPHRVMIAPPFTALDAVREAIGGSNILLGAQNMAPEESGAHTGEISVLMLRDAGVQVVILGHSERRHIYGETDELINRKVRLALDQDLEAILCIGETLEEREAGEAEAVVVRQLSSGLDGVSSQALGQLTIAYEPVWAIGTGKTATPDDAQEIHGIVRAKIAALYDESVAREMTIQYGGSVKPDNIAALMARPDIDGALVGGASLKSETFVPIVRFDAS